MNCEYCGTELIQSEYQSRAADEAPRVVAICPRCKLDTTKARRAMLSSIDPCVPYIRVNPAVERTELDVTSMIPLMDADIAGLEVYMEREVACGGMLAKTAWGHITRRLPVSRITDHACTTTYTLGGREHTGVARVRSDGTRITKTRMSKVSVAPGVSYATSKEWIGLHGRVSGYQFSSTYDIVSFKFNEAQVVCTKYGETGEYRLEVEALQETDDEKLVPMLLSVLLRFSGFHSSLSTFIRPEIYEGIKEHCPKAFDCPIAWGKSLVYTPKVDGERCLVYKMGYLWIVTSYYRRMQVRGWFASGEPTTYEGVSCVLDTECTLTGHYVLTDIIMIGTGQFTSATRDIHSVVRMMESIKGDAWFVDVKSLFPSYKDALNALPLLPYPSDGVMGLDSGSTMAAKLKSVRSIELKVGDDMGAYTAEGKRFGVIKGDYNSLIGNVVELKIECGEGGKISRVLELFRRHDKTSANSEEAVRSTLLAEDMGMYTKKMRLKKVTNYCFALREAMYKAASGQCGKRKRLILDIGSGRGQSIIAMRMITHAVYLMVEPDEASVEMMCKRFKFVVRVTDVEDLRSRILASCGMSSLCDRFLVVVDTLEGLLSNVTILNALKQYCCSVVASFSFNYVYESLGDLVNAKIPIMGSFYSYDIRPRERLVDVDGIRMTLMTVERAVVEWDSERYEEPALSLGRLRSSLEGSRYALDHAIDVVDIDDIEVKDIVKNLTVARTYHFTSRRMGMITYS